MHSFITVKKFGNHKPWMTRELLDSIDAKQQAHEDGNRKLYNKVKKKLSKGIKKSRAKYTHKIQEHLGEDPANAWNDIKKSNKPTNIIFNRDDFFARFDKADITSPTPNPSVPPLDIPEDAVIKQLKRLDSRKGAAPDRLLSKVRKMCADQIAPVIKRLFKFSLDTRTTPKIWKTATIKPLPKTTKTDQPKHFRHIALNSCLCKTMERLHSC